MSQTQASPPAWLAIAENSRSRTGSASALSSRAISVARAASSGSLTRGEQHAAVCTGVRVSSEFDTREY